uniref:serine-rich coiled-coil domain-containing protein 2 n=1 Tax=Monopterus albus TaxID=43700 RepID=UPI0009B4D3D7|nr:serine-rich coiled-coil domain-containing protein 2 [Monopterus albus]
MEEKAPIKSVMVSRLPKFGGRSSNCGASPLSNGSAQPTTPTQDGKTAHPVPHPNGVIRAPPFTLKLKRDEEKPPSSPTTPSSPGDGGEDKAQTQLPSLPKEVKNGSPGTPKIQRSGTLTVPVLGSKAMPRQSSKVSPKVGTKLLNGGPKMAHNGSSLPARTVSESRLVRPKLGCSSPISSSQDSLHQPSGSLKALALENMIHSNSFTHFKQIPSPTSQPMKRSFSFNRAVELAKPLVSTELRPPRSSFLNLPQLSNGRLSLGLGGLNGSLGDSGGQGGGLGGVQCSRTPTCSLPIPSTTPTPTTPSALKKPLLSRCVLTKSVSSNGVSLGCRLAQSERAKQQKTLFPGKVKGDIRHSAATECGGLLGIARDIELTGDAHSDGDGSPGDGGGRGVHRQSLSQAAGEIQEDMSLSSASSLDKGDTSEEFLDDFDSVGDVHSEGDMPDNRKVGSTPQTQLHSCLSETTDWDSTDLTGCKTEHKEESSVQDSQGPLVLSSEHSDVPQASSVELSPSNSSGGTYMWDEEGFESLEGAGPHPLDNYDDPELYSMDILNNLDPPGTAELDDDDLMLDVNLPEDGLHDIDRMSNAERSERAGRQGQRRKHHRWNGPGHFCNDSRAHVSQNYDDLKVSRISSQPVPSEGKQRGYMAVLDELTFEHMSQDCSSLKTQLLKLKALLQLEDTDSSADVPEETEDNTATSQLEELIKEVQVLREELRSRDKTIAQLTCL